tara:strand:- start:4184 stop:5392 length:1209 start_codon:yes stop_codon:yes gene_type:complete
MIFELDNKYIKLNYSLQFSIGILGFFIYLILGNRYELVELADFFKVVAYISIIQIITDYGFDYGNLRNINISKIKKTNLLISTSSVKIVFGIGSFILSFILSCFTDLTFEPTLIFLGAILSILNLSWFFYLTKNSFVYGLFSLSFRIVALFYLFFFVGSAFNLNIILAVLYIPIILPTIIFIIYYYYYDKEEFSQSQLEINFLKSIKDNFTIFFNNVLVSIITTSWPLTLSVFVAPEMVSVYGFIEKVNKGLLLAFRPLPFFLLTGSIKIKNLIKENLIFSYKKFLILIVLFIIVIILIFNLDFILNLFFSNKFIDYMSYFQFYLIQIPITLSLMIIYTYLIQDNLEGLYSISNLIGLIFVLILSSFIKVNIFFPLIFELAVLIIIPVALFIRAGFKKFQKY